MVRSCWTFYHYDDAADRFQYALDALVPGGESAALYSRAEYDLALAKEGQAHQLATASKFAQAASRIQEAIALEPGDPRFPRATSRRSRTSRKPTRRRCTTSKARLATRP